MGAEDNIFGVQYDKTLVIIVTKKKYYRFSLSTMRFQQD